MQSPDAAQICDVKQALAAEPPGSFVALARFNGQMLGACEIRGASPVWEMHPDTDELFYVIEGQLVVTLLTAAGARRCEAAAGSTLVIPRGVWHKPAAPEGATFLFMTPGETRHSDADDPRDSH